MLPRGGKRWCCSIKAVTVSSMFTPDVIRYRKIIPHWVYALDGQEVRRGRLPGAPVCRQETAFMAIHKIITAENPILRQKAKKIHRFDPSIQKLAEEMFETMHEAHGVGLAAPQIAQSIRIFVAEFEDRKVALVNPEIVKAEGEVLGTEGGLSIHGYVGENILCAEKI